MPATVQAVVPITGPWVVVDLSGATLSLGILTQAEANQIAAEMNAKTYSNKGMPAKFF